MFSRRDPRLDGPAGRGRSQRARDGQDPSSPGAGKGGTTGGAGGGGGGPGAGGGEDDEGAARTVDHPPGDRPPHRREGGRVREHTVRSFTNFVSNIEKFKLKISKWVF